MSDTDHAAAVRATIADAVRHQSDPGPYAALHTADAVLVNIAGRRVRSRDSIHDAMTKALETPLAQVLTTVDIEDIRFPTPDVAVVSCIKHVSDQRETPPDADTGAPLPLKGALTYVVVRDADAWRIAVAQTTPITAS